ncbi:phosphotransferase [Diaporthe helianthi]|uniref:Phosphotransferase n=1 Tax=Diaporthe helianthi TaxID=158607 RepID=A0A2P5HIZ9_DIAHE|nr:phosphotransferase [Diaporthe helianthi]
MFGAKYKIRPRDRGIFVDSMVDNRSEELADEWLKFALDPDNQAELVDFVRRYRPGFSLPKMIYKPIRGSYNVNWKLEFEDGFFVMIHVPIPHLVAFPDEKIRAEVAAMRLVRNNTTIPVPEVYGWGTTAENPTGYGPFIIMEYIEHAKCLEHVITDEMESLKSNGFKKDGSDKKLLKAYRQMANIMLQLSTIEGSAIGYPSLTRPPKPSSSSTAPAKEPLNSQPGISKNVHHRPLTQSMNDLIRMGGLPPSVLPPTNKTYNTSHEYYLAMADMHLTHLIFQHNSAVLSPADGREKYVARQLFRKLAREGRLTKGEECRHHDGTAAQRRKEIFQLWCDDMRPSSVLLNEDYDVVGVIDWEMTYFAPADFYDDPPWWLIIDRPEFHDKGLSSWIKEYERFLPLFLEAVDLEAAALREPRKQMKNGASALHGGAQLLALDEAAKDGGPHKPRSGRVRQNWENGRFFVNYCARRNYGFDPIYWKCLDERFFGKNKKSGLMTRKSDYKGRLHLLSEKERAQMEPFVAWKMEDREDEKVVEWDAKDAQKILEACFAGTLGEIDIPRPRHIPWMMTDRPDSP